MATITSEEKKGLQSAYSTSSRYNQLGFMQQQMANGVQTTYIGKVDKCSGVGPDDGSKTVSATPLIQQTDAEFKGMEMQSIPELPYARYQFGIAAIVIDPVPDDICIFNVCKFDISNIKQGTTQQVLAGTYRTFSQSDSVLVGAIHTKKPLVFMHLKQDQTILERAPEGIKVETNKDIFEEVGQDRILELGRDKKETIGKDSITTVTGNRTNTIKGSRTDTVEGDHTGTIQGNNSVTIKGTNTITITGDNTITIDSNNQVKISGTCNVEVSGNITIKAPQITFDTPSASFTGNVSIAGGLSQGASGRAARDSSDAFFANAITAQKTITSNQDVIGGGISLKSHTHPGVQGGNSNTGAPQ